MNPPVENLRLGAINAVAAAAAFASAGACIKAASASMPNEMVVFFRNAVALLLMLPWIARVRLAGLRTQRTGGHLLRAGFGLAAMYCFFYALHHLHHAEAVLLNYTAPLFIPLIAWAWIGERPPWIIIPVSLLGVIGISLIIKPGGETLLSFPAAIGLLSGMLGAAAMVSIRRITASEPTTRIVFYFMFYGTLFSALPMLWAWQTPGSTALMAMIGSGVFALAGQLTLTRAYALVPAARVGAMTYVSVVFAALIGWLFWSETPDLASIIGGVTVTAACILASTRLQRRKSRTPR